MQTKPTLTKIAAAGILFSPVAQLAAERETLFADNPHISVSSEFGFASEYVFRGLELGDRSFQAGVELDVYGIYLGVWTNQPIENQQTGVIDDRIVYSTGFRHDIPVYRTMEVGFDIGLNVYQHNDQRDRLQNSPLFPRSHEFYVGLGAADFGESIGVANLDTSVYYYHDIDIKSNVFEADLSQHSSLKEWGIPIGFKPRAFIGTQFGEKDTPAYNYWGVGLEAPVSLSRHSEISAGVSYADAWNQEKDRTSEKFLGRGENLWWTVAYRAAF